MTPEEACKTAIEKAGGPKRVGDHLNISGPAVSQWRRVPADRVLDVERLSGVSRHALRPDVYGNAPETNHASGVASVAF